MSLLALLVSPPATAQQLSATTGAVGYITLDLVGPDIAANGISFLGLGMRRPVEYQGNAETKGVNFLSDDQANWIDDQFNGPGKDYYVEIASGNAAGITYDISDTIASSKRIVLTENLSPDVLAGVSFKIRRHWTIASIFGPNNEAGLQAGDASTADNILIFDGVGYSVFYYHPGGFFGTGWRNSLAPGDDAGGTVIFPDEGLILKRRQPGTIGLPLMGAVKTGKTAIPV